MSMQSLLEKIFRLAENLVPDWSFHEQGMDAIRVYLKAKWLEPKTFLS